MYVALHCTHVKSAWQETWYENTAPLATRQVVEHGDTTIAPIVLLRRLHRPNWNGVKVPPFQLHFSTLPVRFDCKVARQKGQL